MTTASADRANDDSNIIQSQDSLGAAAWHCLHPGQDQDRKILRIRQMIYLTKLNTKTKISFMFRI